MLQDAIKNLIKMGWLVEKRGDKYIVVSSGKFLHDYRESDLYSPRKLIHLSRAVCKTHEARKIVKRMQPRRLRRRTRQQIQSEGFDNIIPTIKTGRGKEDSWRYD